MEPRELRSRLKEFIDEIDALIERCQTKYSGIDGASKLCKKFLAERKFLMTVSLKIFGVSELYFFEFVLNHEICCVLGREMKKYEHKR